MIVSFVSIFIISLAEDGRITSSCLRGYHGSHNQNVSLVELMVSDGIQQADASDTTRESMDDLYNKYSCGLLTACFACLGRTSQKHRKQVVSQPDVVNVATDDLLLASHEHSGCGGHDLHQL